jgi:hypothetical protein
MMEVSANIVISAVVVILWIIPGWRILGRVGLPPALALIAVVPLFGALVVMAILAYGRWSRFDMRTGA